MNLNEVVLLGAGASVRAGLLTSADLTAQIRECFAVNERSTRWIVDTVDFVIGGLLLESGVHGVNPLAGVDIERFVAAIRSLGSRNYLESSPFVSAWHARIAELERVDGLDWQKIENLTVRYLRELLWYQDRINADLSYLKPLLERYRDNHNLVIATLNYDDVIENLLSSHGFSWNTGIKEGAESRVLDFRDGEINLLKLHGSIDWVYEERPFSREEPVPQKQISRLTKAQIFENPQLEPALVFGQGNKLTAEGPFLDLFHEFRHQLARTRHLVVFGYSFRDAHINQAIQDWINLDDANRITVISRNPDQIACEFLINLGAFQPQRVHRIPAKSDNSLNKVRWDELHQWIVSS